MVRLILDSASIIGEVAQFALLFVAAVAAILISILISGMGVKRSQRDHAVRPIGRISTGPPRM